MSLTLSLSPAGHLIVEAGAEMPAGGDRSETLFPADALQAAFAESSAAGLIALARIAAADELGPELAFWLGFARRLLAGLCGLGEASASQWKDVAPPSDDELADLVSAAPPMRGLEYLDAAVLRTRWSEMAATVSREATADPYPNRNGSLPTS